MFMLSIKLSRKRIVVGALALVVVLGLGIFTVNVFSGDKMTAAAPANETVTQAETAPKAKSVKMKTDEERIAFVQTFGWEVEPEPAEVLEVIIPKEFDSVYLEYNAIQKKQGYDLEKYAGKRCKRYSYVVTNHPTAESEVRVNLLVYKNKLIGGDVCSTDAEGFMHGFQAQ